MNSLRVLFSLIGVFEWLRVIFCLYFVNFVVPLRISPRGNSGRFPRGKPSATVALPIFDLEKLSKKFLVLLTQMGFKPRGLWILCLTLYQLSHLTWLVV